MLNILTRPAKIRPGATMGAPKVVMPVKTDDGRFHHPNPGMVVGLGTVRPVKVAKGGKTGGSVSSSAPGAGWSRIIAGAFKK